VLPFLVDLVLESELDVAAAHLTGVHEEQRNFIGSKGLLANYVVENWL
jgi:hypothetical protein